MDLALLNSNNAPCVCVFVDFSPTTAALYEDVVTVLTVFCEKLESVSR